MSISLTEETIRERASAQSFQRGLEYYRSHAIYRTTRQATPGGVALMACCLGSSDEPYRLRADISASGMIYRAVCTCPYDWGGDCKHIVALLLTYLHQPDEFEVRATVAELLAGIEKDDLKALMERMVENNPDLYDELVAALSVVRITEPPAATGETFQPGQVSEQYYRQQVKKLLKQRAYDYETDRDDDEDEYDEYDGYDEYDEESLPAFLEALYGMLEKARQLLKDGASEDALLILRLLLEETSEAYDDEVDNDGNLAGFIQNLGMPLAETILSLEIDDTRRQTLREWLEDIRDPLDEEIDESELEVALDALKYGWQEQPKLGSVPGGDEASDERVGRELQWARLNVLESQGRIDEFLQLAQRIDIYRYVNKLLALGRIDEAIAADTQIENEAAIWQLAQKLQELGRVEAAIQLAERGLDKQGYYIYELATWLAPLEEARGNLEMAARAYCIAFEKRPSMNLYRRIKQLSRPDWEHLQSALLQRVEKALSKEMLVSIYLEEQAWDNAIAIANQQTWDYELVERVADALLPHRPDWVILTALKQAKQLIAPIQSSKYPIAARWLSRAKQAYLQTGQKREWQLLINDLRTTYARRTALMREISGL